MSRFFLLFLFLIQSLAATASANELVLNLNKQIDIELLPYSQYHIDKTETATIENIKEMTALDWADFRRDQFKKGFLSYPLWVNTTLKTIGDKPRNIVLNLHHVIDNIELEVSANDENTQYFKLGKGSPPAEYHLKGRINPNHAVIKLLPNKTYRILLGTNSENPVIGGFRAADLEILEAEDQRQSQWILSFLLLIFLVSFYNLIVFVSTRNRAFLYHVFYVASLMCYLINDYGYLPYWTGIYDANFLQKLTAFCLVGAYLSMVLFFDSMYVDNIKSPLITRLNRLLVSGGYLLLLLVPLLPYAFLIRLLTAQVVIAILTGIFISVYRERKFGQLNLNIHKWTLRIILVTFAPSVLLYLLNRLGQTDSKWYTDFLLFFSTFIEVILVSLVLFVGVRKNENTFQKQLLTNDQSGLPNALALEEQFQAATTPMQQTLVQIWVSGLDKLEIAFGPVIYKQFVSDIATQIQKRLSDNPLLIPLHNQNLGKFPLFHSDKNTFILLCQPLNPDNSNELQQQLIQSVDATKSSHHNSIDLGVVIGAYNFSRHDSNFDNVIRNSLLALSYGIKNNKKFKYYNPQIGFDEQKRITLLNDFARSLKNNEFFLLWQPQYETKRPRISGVEILTRWKHPEYGLVYPDEFIPMLEQSNRICELSHWIIIKAFEELPALHKKYPKLDVSINLSPRDLLEDGLVEFLDKQSNRFARYIPYITLEITETVMIDDYSKVLSTIDKLQKRGYNISIDDFGSGYASFSYLQKLPANELKIDKSYTDFYKEQTTYAILESIIQLAKRLDMRIVVEGVEHQQQIDLFTNLGAERLQGWGLDKPMSLESLMSKAWTKKFHTPLDFLSYNSTLPNW